MFAMTVALIHVHGYYTVFASREKGLYSESEQKKKGTNVMFYQIS